MECLSHSDMHFLICFNAFHYDIKLLRKNNVIGFNSYKSWQIKFSIWYGCQVYKISYIRHNYTIYRIQAHIVRVQQDIFRVLTNAKKAFHECIKR